MDHADFELIEKATVFQGYFRIDRYRFRHQLFAGGWSGEIRREVFERGHAVVLLPYDPERDAVVMIEQFRIGAAAAGMPMWQREVIAKELSALGIEVGTADSTEAAFRAVESALDGGEPYSLLMLDARRLEEALSLAAKVRELAKIPVVLLLLTHQRVSPEMLRSCEISGTLTKPVAPTHNSHG